MGQTRVDLLHLLEDLRDAYPGDLEETILTEIVANSLDSGAHHLRVLTDPADRTLVVVDDGRGMGRRELSRYHDVAASTKERGEGIGFAGVGIKLGLLVAEEVLTETRRGETHVATRWRLASRQRAPWNWAPPPGWVSERGTAVGLRLKNPLSPLLDAGYVEAALRRHFEPLLDAAFDEVLAEHYPEGVAFVVNGRSVEKRREALGDRAPVEVRLPRKRKAAALGYVERFSEPIEEDRQGIAISTLGKVIRRGWDWLGVTCTSPTLVAGLVEAPGLAAVLTLNKGDFVRAGRRGVTYLAYRKAIQEAASRQLAEWGESRDPEDAARRRATRPLEKDLETVLVDLADDYPALTALVERRAGGQRRLPTGKDGPDNPVAQATGGGVGSPEPSAPGIPPAPPAAPAGVADAIPDPSIPEPPTPSTLAAPAGAHGPKRPSRYGLAIDFEDQPDRPELGRLVESTVWVNTAHPAYARAVASRAEGYHVALTVGLSLAPLAAEPGKSQEFLTAAPGPRVCLAPRPRVAFPLSRIARAPGSSPPPGREFMNRAMRNSALVTAAVCVAYVGAACNKPAAPAASPSPAAASGDLQTDDQKILYALGVMLGQNVANLNITEAELALVNRGMADGATGKKPAIDLQTIQPKIQAFAQSRAAARAVVEKGKAQAFRDAAAKEAGAVTTNSGLIFTSLKAGTGKTPSGSDTVKVHYKGTLTDGTEFDSSYKRGEPIQFPLNGVIACWTEGVQKMKVGEKAKLVCPSEIAYGDQGRPPVIPAGATLVFEVELLDIVKK